MKRLKLQKLELRNRHPVNQKVAVKEAEALGLQPYPVRFVSSRGEYYEGQVVWSPKELMLALQQYGWRPSESRSQDWPQSLEQHLRELDQRSFKWPSTKAPLGEGKGIDKSLKQDRGLLSAMGYKVGVKGISGARRAEILDDVYLNELGFSFDARYMAEWGKPASSRRLKKLAETLAALTRNAKRQQANYDAAIHDWEQDLAYLKRKFYDGVYDFSWPEA